MKGKAIMRSQAILVLCALTLTSCTESETAQVLLSEQAAATQTLFRQADYAGGHLAVVEVTHVEPLSDGYVFEVGNGEQHTFSGGLRLTMDVLASASGEEQGITLVAHGEQTCVDEAGTLFCAEFVFTLPANVDVGSRWLWSLAERHGGPYDGTPSAIAGLQLLSDDSPQLVFEDAAELLLSTR